MNFDFSEKEEAFRKDVRHWLETHLPDDLRGRSFAASRADRDEVRRLRAWQKTMSEAGYVGMDWPREFGGRGASIVEMVILYQEMARAESPQFVNRGGISMLGPTLMKHGTPAQQKRFLPRILTAEEIWCQGFSEPNAGSDLSALQTRAEDRGDHYVVNGQKVWTTLAHVSKWCMLLTRERKAENPRHGLTYLLVDMESNGVEVRPLIQMTGDAEFNEIFFHDVEVPKAQILGEPGEGWTVAMTTLLHERGTLGMALATQAQITIAELTEHVRRLGRGDDRLVRQRVAQHYIEARALQLNGYRAITKIMKAGIPDPEGSLMKLFWSELNQRMAETAIDLEGPMGQVVDGDAWKYAFLRSRANTIEAGTSEILRNIVAERVLGLPRSR